MSDIRTESISLDLASTRKCKLTSRELPDRFDFPDPVMVFQISFPKPGLEKSILVRSNVFWPDFAKGDFVENEAVGRATECALME